MTINNSHYSLMQSVNNYIRFAYPEDTEGRHCNIRKLVDKTIFVYEFSYELSDIEISLFRYTKILPAPAGYDYLVGWTE